MWQYYQPARQENSRYLASEEKKDEILTLRKLWWQNMTGKITFNVTASPDNAGAFWNIRTKLCFPETLKTTMICFAISKFNYESTFVNCVDWPAGVHAWTTSGGVTKIPDYPSEFTLLQCSHVAHVLSVTIQYHQKPTSCWLELHYAAASSSSWFPAEQNAAKHIAAPTGLKQEIGCASISGHSFSRSRKYHHILIPNDPVQWDLVTPLLTITEVLGYQPFHLVIGARGESWALQHLPHFFSAKTEVIYGPHVGKLHNFDLVMRRRL